MTKKHRKPKKIRNPKRAGAYLLSAACVITPLLTGQAVAITPEGVGDPVFGDERVEVVESRSVAASSGALASVSRWVPGVSTGASTSAYIDAGANRVFQASRSENPALLFTADLGSGALVGTERISDTSGSWDMARSGDFLAVGTNGNGVVRPRLVVKSVSTGSTVRDVQLPASSSVGAYVMSIVADASDDGVFWVGTYQSTGPRLYRFDVNGSRFTDHTPGSAWSGRDQKYVRSLASTVDGLMIGVGVAGGEVWMLPRGASTPSEVNVVGVASRSIYSMAASPTGSVVVIGTEAPASVSVATGTGQPIRTLSLDANFSVVDRITVDEGGTAWFTARPSGTLFSLDLNNPAASLQEWGPMLEGSETRAISTSGSVVYGSTGTRGLWAFDWSTGVVTTTGVNVDASLEQADTNPQGIITTPTRTLVGGHWRYQVHTQRSTSAVPIPGEPKAQVRVGEAVYAATYPSAAIYRLDERGATAKLVGRAPEYQTRPRALVHNEATHQLVMGTSGAYGTYGGGLSIVDLSSNALTYFPTPVARQMPFSLTPLGEDMVIGFSTAGEAVAADPSGIPLVVRWSPSKGVRWSHPIYRATHVTGLATITDGAGAFVFGITSAGEAFALDGATGKQLWSEQIPGAVRLSAAGNYVLVMTSQGWREFFPSRSALTPGQIVVQGASIANVQELVEAEYTVAAVNTDLSALRGRVVNPRQVTRISGANRYQTAINVSAATFAKSDVVVLATGTDFPDALTAGPLAAAYNAPALLNAGSSVRADVWAELKRLGASTVVIVGGSGAIPTTVEGQLKDGGLTVTRLGGSTRYDTSLQVAREVQRVRGGVIPAVVTTGLDYPDALSATPAAANLGGAIILSKGDQLPATAATYLRSASSIATVGGLAQKAVESGGLRIVWSASGKDRYATSNLVAKRVFPNTREAFIATGSTFPDGLAAGPATQGEKPVLLTPTSGLTPAITPSLTHTHHATLIGGTGALTDNTAQQIKNTGW